ncbi:NADP-dependent malic enzyme [Bacillus subtilis]|nr:NADP-dependent malic enzyme [Bacillus subtilis]
MSLREEALHLHKVNQGKLESKSKVEVRNAKDLSLAYSPVLQNRVRIFMKTLTKYMIIQ